MTELRRKELRDHFQREVYRKLLEKRFPSGIIDTIRGRIRDMFHPYDTSSIDLQLPRAVCILRTLRKHDAHRVLKTWVNSWATSTRFHSDIRLPCLFGCSGEEDRMSHYCMCPRLYYLMRLMITSPACPLERLGLISSSKDTLLAVACTFSAYHAVKRSNIVRNLPEQESLQDTQTLSVYSLFADTFWVEANEVGLRCLRLNSNSISLPNLSINLARSSDS